MTLIDSIGAYLPVVLLVVFSLYFLRRRGSFNDAVSLQREAVADQKRILDTLQEIKDLLKGRQS
jgi:hypothetical protein